MNAEHADWLTQNFHPLTLGIDQFSGLKIPYYRNEHNNRTLKSDIAEMQKTELEMQDEIRARLGLDAIDREIRIREGTASLKDKLIFYSRRYWWTLSIIAWITWEIVR